MKMVKRELRAMLPPTKGEYVLATALAAIMGAAMAATLGGVLGVIGGALAF
jgi:hypothetical protein